MSDAQTAIAIEASSTDTKTSAATIRNLRDSAHQLSSKNGGTSVITATTAKECHRASQPPAKCAAVPVTCNPATKPTSRNASQRQNSAAYRRAPNGSPETDEWRDGSIGSAIILLTQRQQTASKGTRNQLTHA